MKRRAWVGILIGVAALAATGLALALGPARPSSRAWYTDADQIRVPARGAPVRQILWQPATPVPGPINTSADEYEPRLSADGTLMVFVRGRPGANADLYTSRWTPDGWTAPAPIAELNTPKDELGPELSRDGKSLYFYSDRPGGLGGYDLWLARAADSGWSEPINLGPGVNTEFNEYGPALTPDGTRLYFSSNRPRPDESHVQREVWPATVREARGRHDYDLYASTLTDAGAQPATPVALLNTLSDEGAPAVSPAGDFLYFASDRAGGAGGFDLYRSRLLHGIPQAPENLGPSINSAFNDLDPGLSTDGFRLYFSSNRPAPPLALAAAPVSTPSSTVVPTPAPPAPTAPASSISASPTPTTPATDYGLWASGSREVFVEIEPGSARLAWAELWDKIWPWLLLLTLAGLVGLLLYRLLRNSAWRRRFGKLGLLAQCMLISLVLHLIIASLLAVWQVGHHIGDYIRKSSGGGTRVVLASAGGAGGGIQHQIRGDLTTPTTLPALISTSPADLPIASIETAPIHLDAPATPSIPDSVRLDAAPIADAQPASAAPELDAPAVALPSAAAAPQVPRDDQQRLAATESAARSLPDAKPAASAPAMPEIAAASTFTRAEVAPTATAPAARDTSRLPTGDVRASNPTASPTTPVPSATAPQLALSTSAAPTAPNLPHAESAGARETEPTASSPLNTAAVPSQQAPLALAAPASTSRVTLNPASSSQSSAEPGAGSTLAPSVPSPSTPGPGTGGDAGGSALGAAQLADSVGSSGPVATALPTATAGDATSDGTGSKPEGHTGSLPTAALGTSRAPLSLPTGAGGSPARIQLDPGPSRGPATDGPALKLAGPSASGAPGTSNHPSDIAITGTPGVPAPPSGLGLGLRLPGNDPDPPPAPVETFSQRDPEVRGEILEQMGGSRETERAVKLALDWLASHQDPDGRWSGQHFDDRCGQCGGAAEIDSDAAITSIALLCYLGAGHTHTADGPYKANVQRGLRWLVSRQEASGDLRQGETMYAQALATVALCEAFSMTSDPVLGTAARRAVGFLSRGPDRRDARTRADDTSVLGWQVMAMESARRAGISVPATTFQAARAFLDQVATPGAPGRYAYRPGDAPSPAMTAEAMFVQQLLGHTRDEPRMQDSARFVLGAPPRWKAGAPTYYWYYATLALFQHQGDAWRDWNQALVRELIDHQHHDGTAAGTWDPQDEWSQLGGRIYQTAVCTLSLEVYYRYRPAGMRVPVPDANEAAPASTPSTSRPSPPGTGTTSSTQKQSR